MKKIKLTNRKIKKWFKKVISFNPVGVLGYWLLDRLIKLFEWTINATAPKCPRCGHKLFKFNSNRLDCENCTYQRYDNGEESF